MRLKTASLAWTVLLAAAACSGSNPPPVSQLPPDAGQPDAGQPDAGQPDAGPPDPVKTDSNNMIDEGRQTFRFDTFGDEAFWTGSLKLNQAIQTVPPTTALAVGLKVDVDALPASLQAQIKAGAVDLNAPATTVALIGLNAVVGVKGTVDASNNITSLGVTCALCHSTVDNSFSAGIGHRLDGWANRDLDVGTIIDLAPDLTVVQTLLGVTRAQLDSVLKSWGPGKFDAEVFLDGKATNGGADAAVLIPPAFGLLGVNMHTWTGWGSITYWNAFVATLEMHGKGNFFDTRLDNSAQFPVAADPANHFGHVQVPLADDQVTSKLAALQFYQLAIKAPTPPAGSFDAAAATRGKDVFNGPGKCASCHVPPLFTEPGWNMHDPADVGLPAGEFQAQRAPDKKFRTSPLKGLFSHSKGGFYHDGRFADLPAVVAHYNSAQGLGLTAGQQTDLVEYLKSL